MTVDHYVIVSYRSQLWQAGFSAAPDTGLAGLRPTLATSLRGTRCGPRAGTIPVVVYASSGSAVSWEGADLVSSLPATAIR